MKKLIISLAIFGSILSAGLVNMGEAQAAQKQLSTAVHGRMEVASYLQGKDHTQI